MNEWIKAFWVTKINLANIESAHFARKTFACKRSQCCVGNYSVLICPLEREKCRKNNSIHEILLKLSS